MDKLINSDFFRDPLSEEVWEETYKYFRDETVWDTFRRVAKALASVEDSDKQKEWEEKFLEMLAGYGSPGGRILANAGTDFKGTTMINCFVGPRVSYDQDSIEGILTHLKHQVQTLKSEGGWGENFGYLRPRGSDIKGIGVESPGAVKYMEIFDKTSDIITQGSGLESKDTSVKKKNKIRKGAQMAVLPVWHGDIVEFITAKQTQGRLSKFNISAGITDDFMNKVLAVQKATAEGASEEEIAKLDAWNLVHPDTTVPQYKEIWNGNLREWVGLGLPLRVYKTVSATWLWDLIMESTYNRAEPGVLFLDRMQDLSTTSYLDFVQATNPCGEQVLPPAGICCLGSLNLARLVNGSFTDFDYDLVVEMTKRMVRFLDNVNSYSNAPLQEYLDTMRNKRRIGVGIMGWGSALYLMKVRLGSKKAAELRDKVMGLIARTAYEYSIDLAIEKGMFPLCQPEKHAAGVFIQNLGLSKEYMDKLVKYGIRNSALLSIQPTGSTGIFQNIVSGGLEPIFSQSFIRTKILPTVPAEIADVTPAYWEGRYEETALFKWTKEGDEDILRGVHEGVVYKIDRNRGLTKEIPCEDYAVRILKARGEWDPSAEWAVTAMDLKVEDHVADLKGFARWVDSAISKTVNVPHDYPYEEFKKVYIDAYLSGHIKGITTYRSGTMASVLSTATEQAGEEEIVQDDVKLPDTLPATLKTLRAEGRKWYLTVIMSADNKRPVAVFVQTNNAEKNVTALDAVEKLLALARIKGIPERHVKGVEERLAHDPNTTKIARVTSMCLRHGILAKNIVAELDKVDCIVGSFVFHLRKYLASFVKDGEKVDGETCPNCGSTRIVYKEGCKSCEDCGSGKCG